MSLGVRDTAMVCFFGCPGYDDILTVIYEVWLAELTHARKMMQCARQTFMGRLVPRASFGLFEKAFASNCAL